MAYDDAKAEELCQKIKKNYSRFNSFYRDWRKEAYKCFDYVSGKQFSEEEKLDAPETKPMTVFNRLDVFVSIVCGLEAINREQIQYYPRRVEPQNQGQSDLWNDAAAYVNQDCAADTHHSEAFHDMVVCGMGWTEITMDYETNTQGDIVIKRIDPLMTCWDPDATQRNLSDARWVGASIKTTLRDVKAQWPDKEHEVYASKAFEPDYIGEFEELSDTDERKYLESDAAYGQQDDDTVYVLQYQYWTRKGVYHIQLNDGGFQEVDVKDWRKVRQQVPNIDQLQKIRITKREYRQAFVIGNVLLEDEPLPVQEGFTLRTVTGKRDRNRNYWYGIVHYLFDPQDWTNKLFSEMLYLLMVNAKGGLLAESDAFENKDVAAEEWSDPTRIIFMKPGGLQKVTPRTSAGYPPAMDRLLTISMSMFHEVTGINAELLGMTDKVQAGVLEAQRKQAGITILAWAFDSLRDYRRSHGRVLAGYIRTFLADGRLVRIGGQGSDQYIPLIRDELATEYDVVVSESPQSMNEKDRVFAILMQLLPNLAKIGIGPPPSLVDYIPIPVKLATEWKETIMANQQGQAQAQEAQKQMAVAKLQSELGKEQSETQLNIAKAQNEAMGL